MATKMIRADSHDISIMRQFYRLGHFIPAFPDRKNTKVSDRELFKSMLKYIFQRDYFSMLEAVENEKHNRK